MLLMLLAEAVDHTHQTVVTDLILVAMEQEVMEHTVDHQIMQQVAAAEL